jgi:hypothetical protein
MVKYFFVFVRAFVIRFIAGGVSGVERSSNADPDPHGFSSFLGSRMRIRVRVESRIRIKVNSLIRIKVKI